MKKVRTSIRKVSLDSVWKINKVDEQSATTEKALVEIAVIEHIEDKCNETISNLLLRNMANMHAILDIVNSDCNDSYFNEYHIPIMQLSSLQQVLTNTVAVTMKTMWDKHMKIHFKETSSCFDMVIDPVIGDGDYSFRAIVSQMRKTIEWNDSRSLFRERFTYLGLGNVEDSAPSAFCGQRAE